MSLRLSVFTNSLPLRIILLIVGLNSQKRAINGIHNTDEIPTTQGSHLFRRNKRKTQQENKNNQQEGSSTRHQIRATHLRLLLQRNDTLYHIRNHAHSYQYPLSSRQSSRDNDSQSPFTQSINTEPSSRMKNSPRASTEPPSSESLIIKNSELSNTVRVQLLTNTPNGKN